MNKSIFQFDKEFGYRFIPQLKTRINTSEGGYLLRTNSHGFRNDTEFTLDENPVCVYGDSFTAGDFVSNGKRYTDVLSKNLDSIVYNFGLPGSGTDQQYLVFNHFKPMLNPSKTIIALQIENIRRVNSKYRYFKNEIGDMICYPKPYFELENSDLVLKNVPVPNDLYEFDQLPENEKTKVDVGGKYLGLRNIINRLGVKEFVQKVAKVQPLPEYDKSSNKEWILLSKILKKWVKEVPGQVYVFVIPTYHYIEEYADYNPFYKRFEEFANDTNATVLNPIKEILDLPIETRKKFRFETDIHPTPLAHEFYGSFLSKKLENK